jgi:hypothetical protein
VSGDLVYFGLKSSRILYSLEAAGGWNLYQDGVKTTATTTASHQSALIGDFFFSHNILFCEFPSAKTISKR